MTKTTTIVALTCLLIAGAAAAGFLGNDTSPASSETATFALSSNATAKGDKLAPVSPVFTPPPAWVRTEPVSSPLRQAFASADEPAVMPDPSPRIAAPVSIPAQPAVEKPKVAAKPPAQKSYALLSDSQIAGIRERMKFSPDQESYWPAVESALKGIARRLHATRPNGTGTPQIDTEWVEVQQLKSAAMPLLWQLREDQKREVRSLANLIGLTAVASMI